jgi:hypothetical protein
MNRKEVEVQRRKTAEWAERVENIEGMAWPESFKTKVDISKPYNRLTEFTKQWIYGLLSADPQKRDVIPESDILDDGEILYQNMLAPNWWKLAIKKANGAAIGDGLPSAKHFTTKDEVYKRFMPAYRAIRESFESRPFWHWFTQHAKYTAERDSLKALQGIMMSLTGRYKAQQFENAYENYCEEVPLEVEEVEAAPKEVSKEVAKAVDKIPVGKDVEKDLGKDVAKTEPAVTQNEVVKEQEKIK